MINKDNIRIVGLGGTLGPDSSSERVLRACLLATQAYGAETSIFTGAALAFSHFDPSDGDAMLTAGALIEALRSADAIVIASPGYHGSLSGLIKNALDYTEAMRGDERPYFDGRAVGCIACAHGWQAVGSTLGALRSIVHALRGWPTPLGIGVNSSDPFHDSSGNVVRPDLLQSLDIMARQLVSFASARRAILSSVSI